MSRTPGDLGGISPSMIQPVTYTIQESIILARFPGIYHTCTGKHVVPAHATIIDQHIQKPQSQTYKAYDITHITDNTGSEMHSVSI